MCIRDSYSGGAGRVNNVWTSVAGEIDCCDVRYDRKTEKLKLRIVEPPREKTVSYTHLRTTDIGNLKTEAVMDFDNLHQVLRSLYQEMMPLCRCV